MSIFKSEQQMPPQMEDTVSSAQLPGEESSHFRRMPYNSYDKSLSTRPVERPRRGHDV